MVHVVGACPGQFFHADLDGLFTGPVYKVVMDMNEYVLEMLVQERLAEIRAGVEQSNRVRAAGTDMGSRAHPPGTSSAEYPAVFPGRDRRPPRSRAWMTPTPV